MFKKHNNRYFNWNEVKNMTDSKKQEKSKKESKLKTKSRQDDIQDLIKRIIDIKEDDLDKIIKTIQLLFSNNEFILRRSRIGLSLSFKKDFDFVSDLDMDRTEISELLRCITLISVMHFENDDTLYKSKKFKNIEKIINKLKSENIYNKIISKIHRKNNVYFDVSYGFITREFIEGENKIKNRLVELEINFGENMNEEKEIVIEFDEDQLKSFTNILQEVLEKLPIGDDNVE